MPPKSARPCPALEGRTANSACTVSSRISPFSVSPLTVSAGDAGLSGPVSWPVIRGVAAGSASPPAVPVPVPGSRWEADTPLMSQTAAAPDAASSSDKYAVISSGGKELPGLPQGLHAQETQFPAGNLGGVLAALRPRLQHVQQRHHSVSGMRSRHWRSEGRKENGSSVKATLEML